MGSSREHLRSSMLRHLQRVLGQRYKLGMAVQGASFSAYHPDAYFVFGEHGEFKSLYRRFKAHNLRNNGGDVARLWALILNIKQVISEGVKGDFAEVGVWRGNTAAVLAHFAKEAGREVYLFDTFEGFSPQDLNGIDANKRLLFQNTSLELVKETVGGDDSFCHYVKGWFPGSVTDDHKDLRFSVVSLDADLYDPMKSGLQFFYPRLNQGGILLLHDYSSMHWDGSKKAIDEFCLESGEHLILMPDKSGSAFIRKRGH